MKITPVFLVVLLLGLFATSLVHAQTTEKIALYADRAGTDCSISDTGEQSIFVYMIHVGTGTRAASEFRAPKPDCWAGATFAGDDWNYSVVYASGNSQGLDVTLLYNACLPLPIYLGRMIFDTTGAAQACCTYPVLPSVYYTTLVSLNCSGFYEYFSGESAIINPNGHCPCQQPLAAESTTWGRVKSLYH